MKKLMIIFSFSIILLLCACSTVKVKYYIVNPVKADTLSLKPYATFDSEMINESSALVKSRQYDGVYWTLNDSGDESRIFAVTKDGKLLKPEWARDYTGIHIPDAVNVDWEDITTDDMGNLIIGACGNNSNIRKDLAVYYVKEPHPMGTFSTRYFKKIDFFYPDQTAFPPEKRNFDCEAIFTRNNTLYFLSKHRSDSNTKLYRLDSFMQDMPNPLTKLAEFEIHGSVTAADCSKDGKKLAVLTYTNIWLFEDYEEDNFFDGKISFMPIKAKQCEAIAFDGDELIITNEQTELIKVPMDKFVEVSLMKPE